MYCKLYFVWYIIYWKYSVACPSTKSLGSRRVWAQSWSVLGPWIRSCCSPGTGTGHWRGDQARSRTVSVLAIKTDTVQVLVRTLIWASRSLGPGLGLKILGIGHICPTVRQDDIPHVVAKLHLLYVLRMRGLMFNHWHLLSLTSTNIAVFIPGCGHGQWQDSTDKFYAEMYVNVSRCMADSQLLSLSILAVHPTQSSVTPSLVQGCLQLNDLTFNICHQYFFV